MQVEGFCQLCGDITDQRIASCVKIKLPETIIMQVEGFCQLCGDITHIFDHLTNNYVIVVKPTILKFQNKARLLEVKDNDGFAPS